MPKHYDGLLNPALKGKMAFVTTDTGSRTVGAMLRAKGEEFLKRLRTQELTMHSVSAQALNDMIISGEVEASPTIFPQSRAGRGGKRRAGGLAADGNRPGERGQRGIVVASAASACGGAVHRFPLQSGRTKILESYDYGSAVKEYGFKRWYIEKGMSIVELERRATAGKSC